MSSLRDAFELQQDLVRLVYFDESGTGAEASEPIVVVAAVVINGDEQAREINKDVREIYKLLPTGKRDRFEFKAARLFGHYRKFREDSRYRRAMTEFLTVMRKHRLPIQWCAIDRAGFRARPNSKAHSLKPQDFAFFTSAMFVETWFIQNAPNEGGLLIADHGRSEELMLDVIREMRVNGIASANTLPFEHLVDTLMFSDSKRSVGLQMADFANFFLRRHFMEDTLAEPFYGIIRPLYNECLGEDELLFGPKD
jgi:hypothetical protein